MQKITSSNKHYAYAKKLKLKKYRDEYGCFLIEGEKLLLEALKHGIRINEVFCTEEAYEKYRIPCESNVFLADEKMMKCLCESVTPQGIAVVCQKPDAKKHESESAVILENIQDPGNVGAILRTAAATGYTTAYLCNCADPFSMKGLRSGMSAQFLVDIIECGISEAMNCGREVFAADMKGEDIFRWKK